MAASKMQKVIHDQLEESDAISVMRHVLFEMALLGTGILKGPFTNVKTQYKFSKDEETGASAMMELVKTYQVLKQYHVGISTQILMQLIWMMLNM